MDAHNDLEVTTGSVPTAAFLACAGFEPTRIQKSGGTREAFFVFPAEARAALTTFLRTKRRLDTMLEAAR